MAVMHFSVPRHIISGPAALNHLSTLKGRKAVLVTGGSSMKRFGFLAQAEALLQQAGMQTLIVDGVEPNPSVALSGVVPRPCRSLSPNGSSPSAGGRRWMPPR